METGIKTFVDFPGPAGFTFRVFLEETYNALENYSEVPVTGISVQSKTYGGTWYPSGTVSVADAVVATMKYTNPATHAFVVYSAGDSWLTLSKINDGADFPWASGKIYHNVDGSKTITVSINITIWRKTGDPTFTISGTQNVTLTHIPRASTISATDANIGAKSTIVVNRKSSAYTHSIAYQFGGLSGYITEDGGISSEEVKMEATTINFTVPTSFYDQIPDAMTGECMLTCTTYSGTDQIGDAQTDTFTVTAAQAACAPVVSGTVADSKDATKALTGDAGKLVRYKSTALCTISATAKNGAAISEKKIAGTVVSGDTLSIEAVEISSFAFYAKDSRGYEANVTVEAELIPYVLLTCNPEAARTDSTSGNAVLTIMGNYYNGSFGAVENSLQLKYRIMPEDGEYGDYVDVEPTIRGDTYSAEVSLTGLDYRKSFIIEVSVADAIEPVTKTVPIEQGIPHWDMGATDFRINALLRLAEANHGTELPESGVKDQIFLLYTDGSWSIKIHDGTSWT